MKKVISLLLSFSVIFSLVIPCFAAEAEDVTGMPQVITDEERAQSALESTINSAIKVTPIKEIEASTSGQARIQNGLLSTYTADEEAGGPMITCILPTTTDYGVYEVEIDHSILPEVVLYAFCYCATGDADVVVTNSNGSQVAKTSLVNRSVDTMARYWPKWLTYIKGAGVKTYTITITTTTGNAICAVNLGTRETLAECFGGIENFTTVGKNVPSEKVAAVEMMSSFPAQSALLNTGEWFHYTADGDTFITATLEDHENLGFFVVDAETGNKIFETTDEDCGRTDVQATSYLGYVTAGLSLEAGKDYFICFYSTTPVKEEWDRYYLVYIGVPFIYSEKIDYVSPTSYSVPAATTKTFKIRVDNKFPSSAVAEGKTTVAFNTPKSVNNVSITSLIITAPNGKSYVAAPLGRCDDFHCDITNYFGNTPINGTWTVQIRTSEPLSGLQFKIWGYYTRILGSVGD